MGLVAHNHDSVSVREVVALDHLTEEARVGSLRELRRVSCSFLSIVMAPAMASAAGAVGMTAR